MHGKTIHSIFLAQKRLKKHHISEDSRGRAARAARLTAEAQNLERSGPYVGSFSATFQAAGEARWRRDGGELEASWRRDADGEELGARRRRRWRRDGGETGARWRRRRDEGGGDEGGESGEAGYYEG